MKAVMRWFGLMFSYGAALAALSLTAPAEAAVANVSVVNNRFQPASVTVNVGDQVTWTWAAADGGVPHTTTSQAAGLWDSGIHTQPFDFTTTFNTAGSFPYVCTLHASIGMKGTVTVQAVSTVPPAITTQPISQTVNVGASVTFSVVATGTAPLSYQWKKNTTDIPGANSANLTLNPVTAGDAGSYTVVVSNSAGSATSTAAVLTVNSGGNAPAITTQPASQTVNAGANVTFTVTATGTAPLGYQWKKNGNDIPGANSSSLTLNAVTAADAGTYTVVVSNSAGSATSNDAVLTVNSVATAPVITSQPASQTVNAGANVTFTVIATGTPPLSYQWKKGGTDIPGDNSASLTLNAVTATDAGSYTVVVSNSAGSKTSSAAVLTVQPVITATFNPGTFSGLFWKSDGVSLPTSGSLILKLNGTGSFSAKLVRGGIRSSLSGQFDPGGHVSKTVLSGALGQSTVDLQVGLDDPDHITGTVSDGTFTANLVADRAGFDGSQHIAPEAGRYTVALDGDDENPLAAPGGYSFGTVIVNAAGGVRFSASLADGSKVTQAVPLSKNGDWALYASLYGNKGSMISWAQFESSGAEDIDGDVVWIKPNVPQSKLYPTGFNLGTSMHGSRYQAGSKVLNLSDGQLMLHGGGLATDIQNHIMLDAMNHVTNLSSNKLSLKFSSSTGLFKGKVMDPASSTVVPFGGAVLQKQNTALGWFGGRNAQSGEVNLLGQ